MHRRRRPAFPSLCLLVPSFLLAITLQAAPTTKPAQQGPVVTISKIDDTSASGSLVALDNGIIVLSNPNSRIPLEDVVDLVNGAAPATKSTPGVKLTGKIIGTAGSYNNNGYVKDRAFDGNLDTYFDAPQNASNPWVGLDLGEAKVITAIKYCPRTEFPGRMVGGRFQGSNSPTFRGDQTDLFSIAAEPATKKLTVQEINNTKAFRYVRYLGPEQSACNIAEMEVWGRDASAAASPQPAVKENKPAATTAASSKPAGETYRAVFGDDDQLTAPMAGWSEKGLRLATSLGEIEIPTASLREAWRGTADQVKQAKALPLDPGPEDAAFVVKDNAVVAVRGIALGIDGDALQFKFGDDVRRINLNKLVGVILGGQDAKRDRSFKQSFMLAQNGDVISGQWNSFDKAAASCGLVTPWGAELKVPLSAVSKIRSANGRLVYLSDLKPAAVEQTPYFDRMLTYRIDKSLTGGPLKLIDGDYPRGIAVHARTVLTYDLAGQYAEYKTKVGFQQPEGKLGQAAVRILGDGKVLYEDADARGDAPKPADLSVNVTGVRQLTLEVDFGKNQDTGDRVVWANARLLKASKK